MVLVISVSCRSRISPTNHENWVRHHVDVGDRSIAIRLPASVDQQSSVSDDSEVRFLFDPPDSRSIRSLTLFSPDPTQSDDLPHSIILDSGVTLRYRIVQSQSVGSGGPEAHLAGILDSHNGVSIGVRCDDQDEWHPNPLWCLPFLHLLEFSPD